MDGYDLLLTVPRFIGGTGERPDTTDAARSMYPPLAIEETDNRSRSAVKLDLVHIGWRMGVTRSSRSWRSGAAHRYLACLTARRPWRPAALFGRPCRTFRTSARKPMTTTCPERLSLKLSPAPKEMSLASPSTVITLVHGTGARETAWIDPGSNIARALSGDLSVTTLVRNFKWSGADSHAGRVEAALLLQNDIKEVARKFSAARHILVAHSHGGNVCLYALRDPECERSVQGIVFLATPFIYASRRLDVRFSTRPCGQTTGSLRLNGARQQKNRRVACGIAKGIGTARLGFVLCRQSQGASRDAGTCDSTLTSMLEVGSDPRPDDGPGMGDLRAVPNTALAIWRTPTEEPSPSVGRRVLDQSHRCAVA